MRIVRGSNLNGYRGIPLIQENNKYILVRPLLYLEKNEILEYLKNNNISYVIDKSNDFLKYTRNRFRKHMLPFLKEEDTKVHLKFLKYSRELEKYNDFINKIILEKINNIYIGNKINVNELLKEDEFLQIKILEYIIKDYQKNDILNINDKNFKNLLNLLNSQGNKQIDICNGYMARKS